MVMKTNKQQRSVRLAHGAHPRARTVSVARLLAFWLLLAVVMSANGIFRELALVPAVGRTKADVLSAALGMTVILAVTRCAYAARSAQMVADSRQVGPARVSMAWLGMTVAFEELFGHYVDGKSWSELAGNYAIWRGNLWPLVLLTVGIAPFLWGRWRVPGER